MWKTSGFPIPTGSSADDPSAPSAAASFSVGPHVGSDNYAPKGPLASPWCRVRGGVPGRVHNASMAVLQRGENTVGPLALGGRTLTLVARTTALHLGDDGRGALIVRARPAHVEVLEPDGRRHVVRIRDVEYALVTAIAVGTAVSTYALRLARRNRRSSP
jgi:hypothetical protein